MNKDPIAEILRDAWNVHRLDTIRGVVARAILVLAELDPVEVLGPEFSPSGGGQQRDSVRAAFLTCRDELGDGCGQDFSTNDAARVQPEGDAKVRNTREYAVALEQYHVAACRALETSFAEISRAR